MISEIASVQGLLFLFPGKAICKSLETDIAECMGVSLTEVVSGLVRLLFVRCVAVQLDAAHSLCKLLGKLLVPGEFIMAVPRLSKRFGVNLNIFGF